MKGLFFLILFITPKIALAEYNANFSGKVTHVLTYTYSAQILIRVEGSPTTHPECSNLDYLIVPASTPENLRQSILARLLTAYTTGESVNIGYDKNGSCVSNRIQIYRVG